MLEINLKEKAQVVHPFEINLKEKAQVFTPL